jgi:hypothetical protein
VVTRTIKAAIVALISMLPTWTWTPAAAIVRAIWPGFSRA